jgi:protein associated with RNAse G/E
LRAKVRGIYTTALTKLLLENDFQIVQPSQTIKARFGIPDNNEPPDIKLKDRHDLQGVVALGTPEAINSFHKILHSTLEDAITRKWNVSVDGIYKGIVIGENENAIQVKIGEDTVGLLPKHEAPSLNRGESQNTNEIVVQVERKRIGRKIPVLTTRLKIVGNYAILAQKSNGGVSLKIRDINKRAELYALGKKLAPEGWGIIWREPAAHKPKNVLEDEVARLNEKVKALKTALFSADAPALLVEGLYFMDVEFPYNAKRKLDGFRASVSPTIEGHHFYKSCGGNVSAALEMAEKLLEKGQSKIEVEELFKGQIHPHFPEEGSKVNVEHVKLSGAVFHLGQATIEAINSQTISYSRTIKADGFYDGLGVAKEAGDKAVSETKLGEWHITTSYFSKEGKWKGTYININTPVEIYPEAIRYIDLEVDICVRPNGETKIVDREKLEKALEKGLVSKTLFEKVENAVKAVTEKGFVEKLLAKFI